MNGGSGRALIALLCWLLLGPSLQAESGGSVVTIVSTGKGYELRRNGEPYFIRGAYATEHFDELVAAGGNSIRTYGEQEADQALANAKTHGLTVTLGFWMGHPRHGFDYYNSREVGLQMQKLLFFVETHKKDPALLCWAIGNEVEMGLYDASQVWRCVNEAARLVKQLDPNHPVMTVVADVGGNKIAELNRYCPDLDLLGVNAYSGLPALAKRLREQGWRRPYLVSEFGPVGQWESGLTSWNAPLEPTSTQKADTYLANYQKAIAANHDTCLGAYVFKWGWKQEATATWHGMFLRNGERLGAVDAMTFAWSGHWPTNRCPQIKPLRFASGRNQFRPLEEQTITVTASDTEQDALSYRWEVVNENRDVRIGGDQESAPAAHPECVLSTNGPAVKIRMPGQPELYRLFVYVYDRRGNAATANIPFMVRPN